MRRKSRDSRMRLGERYGEIKHRGGKIIQRWRGSSGNIRLSHLLMSFLFLFETRISPNGASGKGSEYGNSISGAKCSMVTMGLILLSFRHDHETKYGRTDRRWQQPTHIWSVRRSIKNIKLRGSRL